MKLSDIFHGDSLKAEELKGQDVPLTIDGWSVKEFEEHGKTDKKIELRFRETDRTLILNKTNGYAIAEALGTEDTDEWVGAKVTIYPTKTDFQGKRVDCIRVRGAEMPQGVTTPAVPPSDSGSGEDIPF